MNAYIYKCSKSNCISPITIIKAETEPNYEIKCDKCGSIKYLKSVVENIDDNHHNTQAENEAILSKQLGHPFCPYCHSAMVDKISGFSKGASVALFGIFAMGKVTKQWHCKSCGSDF